LILESLCFHYYRIHKRLIVKPLEVQMPHKKKAKALIKSENKKAPAIKLVEDASISRTARAGRQASAVVIFAIALLFAFIILIKGEKVWTSIHEMFFGLFGACAYLWPPVLIYIALMAALDKPHSSIAAKIWEAAALITLICSVIHIFLIKNFTSFYEIYQDGITLKSGGIFGFLIGEPLNKLFGETGALIIIFLLIFIFLVLITGVTLIQILSVFIPALKNKMSKQSEKKGGTTPEPIFFNHKKPKFNIDIDLGAESLENMPLHPVQSTKPETDNKSEKKQKDKKSDTFAGLDALVSKIAELNGNDIKTEPIKPAEPLPTDMKQGQQGLYYYPPLTILKHDLIATNEDISEELKSNAARLVDTLRSFGVETRIIDISRGPAVTRYELQPSAGVKISRITSLSDDIALNLAAAGVRIEAPIPNKAAVGIEVPNKVVSIVNIRDIIDSKEFRDSQSKLTVALGRDIAGNVCITDIAKMPHILIAGATGSGKSVCINAIIISLLYKASPEEVRFLMVDPKVVELGVYNGIPHLLVPVVTDPRKAAGALNWAVTEMLNRYKIFANNNVRDIKGFNRVAGQDDKLAPMPQIVIIIDELADLMMAAPNDVEEAICRLAQMARAAGMHLVIATQRPSVDVITGIIKANIPSRIAFEVSSQVDSRTILDGGGAEKLLGRGDMLFLPVGASKPIRVQGCFVSDKEVETVIDFVKESASADYKEEIMDEIEKQAVKEKSSGKNNNNADDKDDADTLMPKAIECVVDAGIASTSLLQRRLKLGYARAARIIDEMEARGIVGPFDGSKPRPVLISRQQYLEMYMSNKD
jgi:S-DNA-T family DNA segregation ATPase FtsK/SpoIIIE